MQMSADGKMLLCGSLLALSVLLGTSCAFALSELKEAPGQAQQQQQPAEGGQTAPAEDEEETAPLELPMPDPLIRRDGAVTEPTVTEDKADEPQVPVEVIYDISKAPEPVRRMRELIVEAAASGDIERLRPLLGKGVTETQVSIVESEEGPVETLKGQSGDPDGIEVLAILLDVLATGFVHVGKGTPDEMYVWPYFAEKPLAGLTPPEKVDLLRIVTAGDYADMQEFGSYNFYRVGITPDGQWKFFLTGE